MVGVSTRMASSVSGHRALFSSYFLFLRGPIYYSRKVQIAQKHSSNDNFKFMKACTSHIKYGTSEAMSMFSLGSARVIISLRCPNDADPGSSVVTATRPKTSEQTKKSHRELHDDTTVCSCHTRFSEWMQSVLYD